MKRGGFENLVWFAGGELCELFCDVSVSVLLCLRKYHELAAFLNIFVL
jgi:hypothetical protein